MLKCISGLFILVVVLASCDPTYRLVLDNKTDSRIYVVLSYNYPEIKLDTTYADTNNPYHSYMPTYKMVMPNQSTPIAISSPWEAKIRELNKSGMLVVYVFDARSVDSAGWKNALIENSYRNRMILSADSLQKSDWHIQCY